MMESKSSLDSQSARHYAELLLQAMVGRTDAYAVQQLNGAYLAVRRAITIYRLENHFQGRITLGSYLLTADGHARCGVYDFDEDTEITRQSILWLWRWFRHWEIELCIELSGRKGYHAWVITKRFLPAYKIIALLQLALAQMADETGTNITPEIFPKQSVTQDLGSLIKLPWRIHRKTANRAVFLDRDFSPLPDWGMRLISNLPTIEESMINLILAEYPENIGQESVNRNRHHSTQKEIADLLTYHLKVGERRPTLVRVAGYLRYRRVPEEVALGLLLPWAEKMFDEPLPREEVERHIRGIYHRYGDGASLVRETNVLECIPDEMVTPIREIWR